MARTTFDDLLNERASKARGTFEIPVLVAALAVVPVISGYGDVFPVTIEGRLAATVLMLLGIGFVAFITASIAAHFVEAAVGAVSGSLLCLTRSDETVGPSVHSIGTP